MSTESPRFRSLRREELDEVLNWARDEGWNPGLADAEAFWTADPQGFWGMEYGGRLIGSASTVVYEGGLGFVGLYIVVPEFRGRGWGSLFWKFFIGELQARLGPQGGAALDGVFAMQSYYARSGFQFTHRNLRMVGIGRSANVDARICALAEIPFSDLLDFDTRHFGARRPEFLKLWRRPPSGSALAYRTEEGLQGYGVIRQCHRGFKIGPLFASTPEIAESLFVALSGTASGEPIFLDIPEINPDAVALAARHGLKESFGCARMTYGHFPQLPWRAIYGVTTFELG